MISARVLTYARGRSLSHNCSLLRLERDLACGLRTCVHHAGGRRGRIMHPMMIAGVLLHVTLLAVLAFFVLYAAQKAQGLVRLLGNVVGVWLLLLVVLAIAAAVTAPMFGGRPFGLPADARMEFRMMHEGRAEDLPTSNVEPGQPVADEAAPSN